MHEFRSIDRFLLRVSDIYALDEDVRSDRLRRVNDCHIYLLGKQPRLSLVLGTLRVAPISCI